MNNRYKIKTSTLTTKEQIKILKEDLKLSFTKIKALGHKKAIFLVDKLYIYGKVKKICIYQTILIAIVVAHGK